MASRSVGSSSAQARSADLDVSHLAVVELPGELAQGDVSLLSDPPEYLHGRLSSRADASVAVEECPTGRRREFGDLCGLHSYTR